MSELAMLGGTPVHEGSWPKWPIVDEREIEALRRVIESGNLSSARSGGEGDQFEQEFAAYQGAKYGIGVTSGTSAIHVALQALGLGYGDEVIVPPYTFIASVSPVLALGAVPVFADIHPDTYNIDPAAVEAAITPRTVGIIPVHFGGLPADMDSLRAIAEAHGLWIMEDAAQAWGAQWKGEGVGHLGNAGIFSFQASKNITSGEGGIILTDDDELREKCWSFRNCGRTTTGVGYLHYNSAGQHRLSELHAAVLRVQLERYPEQLALRERNGLRLAAGLAEIPGIRPLVRPPEVTQHPYHLFMCRYDADQFGGLPRKTFVEAMQKEGIDIYHGYSIPLNQQPVFKDRTFDPKHAAQAVDYGSMSFPVAERACASEALWMRQSSLLSSDSDIDDVVAAAAKVHDHVDELRENVTE